jgi:N,N'-diacetyllegionaminate synthase
MMKNVIIIAEAGVNHNGNIENAKKLIDIASLAGADYVKFQTFNADKLVSKNAKKAEYQQINTSELDDYQLNMLKRLELSNEQHIELISYCNLKGIKFLSSAFDNESIDFLASLKIGIWKIPSGEITNFPYLKKIAMLHEPIILSTGMCNMSDISDALFVLMKYGITKEQITVLHCNTQYPTPFEDVNLNAMKTIADTFDVKIGYSDHTLGIEVPIAAVALGAVVIEKHFTLNRNMDGPDHKASLEPDELITMIKSIRNIEKALGSKTKEVSLSESQNIQIVRKCIVASKIINIGDKFSEENLTVKRAGSGLSPMLWESLIGEKAKKKYNPDDIIEIS